MAERDKVTFFDIIGTSGKYQTVLYLSCFYSWWFIGTALVTVQLLAPMVTIYWDWDAHNPNRTTFSSNDCRMEDILELNRTSNLSNSLSRLIYVSQYSRRTLTEELDLVCERSWLVSFANFMCMLGLSAGNLLLRGSETYGRRRLFISAGIVTAIMGLCMSFTSGYVMLAVCSFVFRASISQTSMLLFIQTMETVSPVLTPYVGLFVKSGLLVGQTVLTCAAWIMKDWFHIQLFQTALTAALPLVNWYILESPTWLAVRGRYDEAREVLVTIVRRNGRKLEEEEPKIDLWLEQMKVRCEIESTAEKGNVRDLFKNKRISLITCAVIFTLISQSFIFTGLSMNTESFGSGLYVDLTLSNALSLVSLLVTWLLLMKFSVRVSLILFSVFEGLSCIAYPIVCGVPLARSIIAVLGRMFITPLLVVNAVYYNQVFPTSVRGVGTGLTFFISFLLSSVSPFTKELGEITSVYVPFILFAVLSLTSAAVLKLMPETQGKPMMHTVQDLKNLNKRKKEVIAVTTTAQSSEAKD